MPALRDRLASEYGSASPSGIKIRTQSPHRDASPSDSGGAEVSAKSTSRSPLRGYISAADASISTHSVTRGAQRLAAPARVLFWITFPDASNAVRAPHAQRDAHAAATCAAAGGRTGAGLRTLGTYTRCFLHTQSDTRTRAARTHVVHTQTLAGTAVKSDPQNLTGSVGLPKTPTGRRPSLGTRK